MQRNQSYVITKHAVKEEVHNAGRAGIGVPDHVWEIIRDDGNLVNNYL